MKNIPLCLFAGVLLMGCAGRTPPCPVDRVDVEILLSRMTNVTTFAERPLGDSFLESTSDPTGGNQDWAIWTSAEPSGRITLLDVDGPGYISRIWTAGLDAKYWHIFIDGETEPRIHVSLNGLFGKSFPFKPPLAGWSSGGRYSLFPIPFSRSIRIEVEPDTLKAENRNYYHINYTLLNLAADAVESFPREWSDERKQLVADVNAALSGTSEEQETLAGRCMNNVVSKPLGPGSELVLWEDDGRGLLKSFCIRVDSPDAAGLMNHELLRLLRLQMFWDNANEPSVDVPLGDFFCNPFYTRSFSSMALGRVDDIFVCRFPMPYKQGARVVLRNMSAQPARVSLGAEGLRGETGGLTRRFHAVWRASTRSGEPLGMMETTGSGHYVGCFLTAIGQDGSWNILEGDETLSPDPGRQPPQEGTGLEDYFGGAYYYTSLFDLPFHGLIEKGAMRTDQYRFHMLEGVDYRKSFEAEIEFGHGNLSQGYMSSVMYWYSDTVHPVPLPPDLQPLLARPADRFELHGLMSQFFLLERDGLYADAADRMAFFAERYSAEPWSDLFKARELGYRERIDGFDAVRPAYESLSLSEFPPAAQAASDRLWMEKHPDHALLGIHALCEYRLLLNGEETAAGEGQGGLRVLRLKVSDGQHAWQADLTPTRQGSFFSLCLRTQAGDITSAGEWDVVRINPQPGQPLPDILEGRSILPNMTVWAFEPNAWVDMQSPAIGINLWSFWAAQPLVRRVLLQKEWTKDAVTAPVPDRPDIEAERSAEELRMHAID